MLRGVDQNAPTTTTRYVASDLPMPIPPSTSTDTTGNPIPGSVSSSIVVPDSFIIEGDKTAAGQSVMQVQLNLTYANDPDLTATLYHYSPSGTLLGQVILFSDVGRAQHGQFHNTVFDDNAATPIQHGSAPFSAIYDPQESLATVFAPTVGGQQGMNVQGTWTLVVPNTSTTGTTGTFKGWSLTFQKPLPTNGLGQPGSDDATVSFQLLTLGQTDALSSQAWSPVGDASSTDETGEVTAIAVDPSDPTGNTVYVGGASGGVWKTTDFLTTNPNGPTWIPLTNFGPSAAINISSISIFPRNDNPDQSIIIAATGGSTSGEQGTDGPGRRLPDLDRRRRYLEHLRQHGQRLRHRQQDLAATARSCRSTPPPATASSSAPSVNQVAVDPQLSPTGQVIIYAAISGPGTDRRHLARARTPARAGRRCSPATRPRSSSTRTAASSWTRAPTPMSRATSRSPTPPSTARASS